MNATPVQDTRVRWVGLTIALFFLFIVLGSTSRQERILYGALPIAGALLCLGRFFWLYARIIIERKWHVFRFRRFEGRSAIVGFAYPMKALAGALSLMALFVIGIWLRAFLTGA
jgi:hypothetical protein